MKKFLSFLAVAAVAVAAVLSCEKKEEVIVATGISLNPTSLELTVGETATLAVAFAPENITEKPEVVWSSSNDAIATVREGVVTAVAAGEATITATAGELKAQATVKVSAAVIELVGITIEPSSLNLVAGETGSLSVKYNPENATNKPAVEWSSSNDAIATVKDGRVTAVAAGDATITAKAGDKTATASVVVTAPPAGIISIDGDFSDWADIKGVSEGTHGMFKFAFDDNYAYFYTWRTTEGRYTSLWGDGVGYIYFAFDLDNNAETGESLNGNGPYEFIGYIYCFGGTAEAPEIKITAAGGAAPSPYTVDNVAVAGKTDENGAYIEYRIPRTDIPALTNEFTVISWGNKDLSKVKYPYPFVEVDTWDYTPSAEYLADTNLWKAVDAANTVTWYYNPNWAGEQAAPETSFKESTWTVKLGDEDTAAEWTTQMKIHPSADLLLDVNKKYTFTAKVFSSTGTHVFFKMYQDGVDWPESFESPAGANRIAIAAGETKEIKVEDFIPLGTPQILLIDFAQHGANNTIHVKDITLTVTGEVAKPVDWDYTPSEEYKAANNLWKPIFDANAEKYYYYHCTSSEWNGQDILDTTVPFLTKKESTYELNYENETGSSWQNQFFIFPDAGKEIALKADKTYKLKVTLGTNVSVAPGFFKISKADPTNAKGEGEVIWEAGTVSIEGATPLVLEKEISGVECNNIIFVMDFGGNPANTKIYIKDITLVEAGSGSGSGSGSGIPDYDLITGFEW